MCRHKVSFWDVERRLSLRRNERGMAQAVWEQPSSAVRSSEARLRSRMSRNCDHSSKVNDGRQTTYGDSFLHGRFVHQQNRNIVAHRIDPLALATLEALTSFLLHQRLLANWTHENFEKIL